MRVELFVRRIKHTAKPRPTTRRAVGLFLGMYVADNSSAWQAQELHHTTPAFSAALIELHPKLWLMQLQKMVEMGIAFRKMDPTDKVHKFGRIKRVGSRWVWVQLPPLELVAMGFPADCPGLLF